MRIVLALTVWKFDLSPVREVWRILELAESPLFSWVDGLNVPSDDCSMHVNFPNLEKAEGIKETAAA